MKKCIEKRNKNGPRYPRTGNVLGGQPPHPLISIMTTEKGQKQVIEINIFRGYKNSDRSKYRFVEATISILH